MLKAILSPFSDRSYAVLRIVSGLLFSFHGMQKIFGVFAKGAVSFGEKPQAWIGGLIELLAGLAIAFGLFTRCAAFVASGTMAVAYWQFHVINNDLAGVKRFIPGTNGGELAALYCFLFLFMACRGAGAWSVDAKREAAAAGS